MCRCSTHKPQSTVVDTDPNVLTLRVEDMTCGHCAGRITKAIQAGIPGAVVAADPASRTLGFTGTTDREAVRVLIAGAGYTPSGAAFA